MLLYNLLVKVVNKCFCVDDNNIKMYNIVQIFQIFLKKSF